MSMQAIGLRMINSKPIVMKLTTIMKDVKNSVRVK